MKLFYKPKIGVVILDIFVLWINYMIVLGFFPLTTDNPFAKYFLPAIIFSIVWVGVSYFLRLYTPWSKQSYFNATLHLFLSSIVVFLFFFYIIAFHFHSRLLSEYVLFSVVVMSFTGKYTILLFYFTIRYAVQIDNEVTPPQQRLNAKVIAAPDKDVGDMERQARLVKDICGEKVFSMLENELNLKSGNCLVCTDANALKNTIPYQYDQVFLMAKLNNVRDIKKLFVTINDKIADDGIIVCFFKTKSTYKKEFLRHFPPGLNWMAYSLNFIYKRILPKLFLTNRFYFDVSEGKNQVLPKSQVLGLLYGCGFTILKDRKRNNLTYVFAQRVKQPEGFIRSYYGPLIKLSRFGKDGNPFFVYKMRTMHPYSEFLQQYIYEKYHLQEGGKFNRDIRVTSLGRFMRRYWIDELPMMINLFKGEMKLVGVRPLSPHYFSLYKKELQRMRIHYKPGLLPPFYADMPRTFDEIEQSELRYLRRCNTEGVFATDMRYLWRIISNILIKKARSA